MIIDMDKINADISREAMSSDALIDWIYKYHKLRAENDLREWLGKCGRLHYCPQRCLYVINGMAGCNVADILYSTDNPSTAAADARAL